MIFVALLFAAACANDPPPSCRDAITHYYGAGCVISDEKTMQPYTADEMIASCIDTRAGIPPYCSDELDALLVCYGTVKSPATDAADCDCDAQRNVTCQ